MYSLVKYGPPLSVRRASCFLLGRFLSVEESEALDDSPS